MSKIVHISKWISFAILTFVIVEETPSGINKQGASHKHYLIKSRGGLFYETKSEILPGFDWSGIFL